MLQQNLIPSMKQITYSVGEVQCTKILKGWSKIQQKPSSAPDWRHLHSVSASSLPSSSCAGDQAPYLMNLVKEEHGTNKI